MLSDSLFWDWKDRGRDIHFSLGCYEAFDLLDEFPPPIRRRLFGKVFQCLSGKKANHMSGLAKRA